MKNNINMEKDIIYSYEPLWGSWKIENIIGKGSYGSVFKISKEINGQRIFSAVKHISIPNENHLNSFSALDFSDDNNYFDSYIENLVKNIEQEIQLLYTLRGHSNIISYEDHLIKKREESNKWDIFIKMEYATSLKNYIKSHKMSEKEVIKLALDILNGLELLRTNGIIHRDIKEDNLFLSNTGSFKIGDFGVSTQLYNKSHTLTKVGTILYMAPEVYKGEPYNITSDIYSLGIVLYKLLNNGRIPFLITEAAKIKPIDIEEAIFKRLKGAKLTKPIKASSEFGQIILKACEYDPKNRFKTPLEMLEAINNLSCNTPIEHTITSIPSKELNKECIISSQNITESINYSEQSISAKDNDNNNSININKRENNKDILCSEETATDYSINATSSLTDAENTKSIFAINQDDIKPVNIDSQNSNNSLDTNIINNNSKIDYSFGKFNLFKKSKYILRKKHIVSILVSSITVIAIIILIYFFKTNGYNLIPTQKINDTSIPIAAEELSPTTPETTTAAILTIQPTIATTQEITNQAVEPTISPNVNNNGAKDTTPPAPPENLKASIQNGTDAFLTWDPSTDNIKVERYIIRATQHDPSGKTSDISKDFVIPAEQKPGFTLQNLSSQYKYYFLVIAVDNDGNYSKPSKTYYFSIPLVESPKQPQPNSPK